MLRKIVITLDERGRLHVEAPLNHKALCYKMLDAAGKVISSAKAPDARRGPRLIVPGGLEVPAHVNGHG